MKRKSLIVAAIIAVSIIALGAGAALAMGSATDVDDDNDAHEVDIPITGPDLEKASAAALEFTNGGRVTATEVEDEESYYEVEVTLDDGSQVDVQLDEEFNVVGSEADGANDD